MALPVAPVVPMTVAEYAALPEDGEVHDELQEGVLVPMAGPDPEHQTAISEFEFQVRAQLPPGLRVVQDVDVDLPPADPAPGGRPAVQMQRTRSGRRQALVPLGHLVGG